MDEWVDCAGATGYTVTIYPTGATRTISGNIATSLVTLNGADNVTIDGRLGMTGAPNSLIFTNSNATTGSTIKFINDATNNVIRYSSIQGAAPSYTTGAVFFSTASATGNNYNIIEYSSIYGTAYTGLYSEGTAGMDNKNNRVFNCNFYNVNTTLGCYISGIDIEGGNTKWIVEANSFYLTASTPNINYWPLLISSPTGNEYQVINNYIGGQSANAGGSSLTISNTGYILTWYGIIVTVSTSGVSEIKNNCIKNINFTTYPSSTGTVRFLAISSTGRIDVNDNVIGDEATGSINITVNANSTYSGGVTGIIKSGDGTVNNNKIGSFTINGTISYQLLFNAIQITGSLINDVLISGNVIGNESTANSIQTASGATPAVTFGGIFFGTAGSYQTTVSNNIIANVDIGCTSTMPFFIGLNNQATGGSQTIIGNSIYDITTASSSAGYFSTPTNFPAICGIRTNNTIAGSDLIISNNLIRSLYAPHPTALVTIFGIHAGTGTSGSHAINGNFIHSFSTTNTASGVWQKGIVLTAGTATISNNMVRLNGNGINTDNFIIGIESASTSASQIFFNSSFVGGTATSANPTVAYYRSSTGTTDIRNNIFVNARSGGTGTHYAYYLASTANLTSNYNIYSNNGIGVSAYAGGLRTSLAQIQTGTGQDANSLVAVPSFVNPNGNAATVDLHINAGSIAIGKGIAGTGLLTDFDNQVRLTGVNPNGPCIGADERITAPYGTNTYGIYASDGIGGNISDCEIVAQGGAPGGIGYLVADPADANWTNVNISGYQVISASNYSCTGVDLTFITADGTPDWLLGNGSSPYSGSTSPIVSEYSSTGRKDILESVKIFKDFVNITMDAPDPGTILGAPSGAGCPTTYTYTSSEAGSAGFSYSWLASAPGGCSATVTSPFTSSTDITFVNQTGVNQIFLVTLDIETECCGPLMQIRRYITIYPGPVQPTVSGSPFTICTGGALTLVIDVVDPSYSYDWYDAATGGTFLGSGSSYAISNLPVGTNSYFVQSTNSFGCSSQRTEVIVEGQDESAPSIDDQSTCGDNDVTILINAPGAGYSYNWYSSSCLGTLVQSGASTSYTDFVTATTNFYVSAVPPGCAASTCATVTVTYNTPPNPIVWLGVTAGLNNWFKPENWTDNCLPTCATNVSIPDLVIDPDIGFNASLNAEAGDINIAASAVLSFSDSKAKLLVCGNFNHLGVLTTNNLGTVEFGGTVAQTYNRSGGTGDFNDVRINIIAASPLLTISNGNMELGSSGSLNFQNGKIVTGSNILIVKNTSTVAISGHNFSRYISGNLRRYILEGTFTYPFPVGVSDRYTLAELLNTGLTGVSYIDAMFNPYTLSGILNAAIAVDFGTPYVDIASEGIWQLDADAAPTGGTYSIKLWFNDGGGANPFTSLTTNMFGPLKRPSASSDDADWTAVGGTLNAADAPGRTVAGGYAQRTGWDAFCQFAIGISAFPLPVELLSFDAIYNGKTIDLVWITSSEKNNDYFSVEKSLDSRSFNSIGTVKSLALGGNSNSQLSYTFEDRDVTDGIFYYRLQQIDFNGNFSYSPIVPVSIGKDGVFSIQPNPANRNIEVKYSCNSFEQVVLSIYDDKSKLVMSEELNCEQGIGSSLINIEDLAKGIYIVTLKTQNNLLRTKLIKL